MAIDNSITFGGVNSADYGIYIGGEGVFNAPERDVEMVSIPGRNGSFALDNGRFENIEVTYPAFNFEPDDYETFAQNLADFRSAICSLRGYQRLTDTFHPDEYRMATYIAGLEIKPIKYNTASEFNIVFNCKPQRFLTSGETAQAVADGETITNPTLFDASPLIRCNGYGAISLGGAPIEVQSVPIGDVLLSNGASISASKMSYSALAEMARMTIDASKLATNDKIYVGESILTYNLKSLNSYTVSSVSIGIETVTGWTSCVVSSPTSAYFRTKIPMQTFKKGTAANQLYSYEMRMSLTDGSGTLERSTSISFEIDYDGANTITFSATKLSDDSDTKYVLSGTIGQINGYSTIIIDDDVIIDLDIGEAYFDDASHTSANYSVSIPAILPTLAPGSNVVSFDNTFTTMEITPRWWKI